MNEDQGTRGAATYDLANFSIRDMTECGKAIRVLGEGAACMEEAANRVVAYLHNTLVCRETGARACTLVRIFKTHPFAGLSEGLQAFARRLLRDQEASPEMKCLALLATAGAENAWQARGNSRGHQAIPLPSEEVVHQIPMIRNLISQMGLDINTVIRPDPELLMDMEQKSYNVFFVPEARGCPYVPAQQEFVESYGIRSVLGFGGLFPSGDIFAVILFANVPVSLETAGLFRPLALNVKIALLPFENAVFAGSGK